MIQTTKIEYNDGNTRLEGYAAYDDAITGKRPAVLVVHDWTGRNEFACKTAEKLTTLGYVGFALDMYGNGKLGTTKEEKTALMQPFMTDRDQLLKRMQAALAAVRQLSQVDPTRIAVIGFCFGGLCALDLARSGADIRAAVSFHGSLLPHKHATIQAKILAIHGHDDPMVTPEQVLAFQTEMTQAGADWQTLIYGNTMHAFTNPEANDPDFGTVYSATADKRSWIAMKHFLEEIFS